MSEINVCSECVKKKVNDLIAHSDGRYTEAHRQQLETLSEEILDQMAKPVIKEKEVVKEVSVLTAEQRADLDWAQKMRKEKKDTLVKSIQANSSKELWPDDELNAMSDTLLEKLEKSVKANKTESDDTDYSAQSAGNFGSNRILDNEEAPLYPTGVEVELKK